MVFHAPSIAQFYSALIVMMAISGAANFQESLRLVLRLLPPTVVFILVGCFTLDDVGVRNAIASWLFFLVLFIFGL